MNIPVTFGAGPLTITVGPIFGTEELLHMMFVVCIFVEIRGVTTFEENVTENA
jgi:hypothetical protein